MVEHETHTEEFHVPQLTPRVKSLVSLDGATALALKICLADESEVFTRMSLFRDTLNLQALTPRDKFNKKDGSIDINEGWVMDNTVPFSWCERLLSGEEKRNDDNPKEFKRNTEADQIILSAVPFLELMNATDVSQVGIFGQSPQARFSLYSAYFALRERYGNDMKISTNMLATVLNIDPAVVEAHMRELDGSIFTYHNTNKEEYRHYQLKASLPGMLRRTERAAMKESRFLLYQAAYDCLVSARDIKRALTGGEVARQIIWERLPYEYQQLTTKGKEKEVRRILIKWQENGYFETSEDDLSFKTKAYAVINKEWDTFIQNIVNRVQHMISIDMGYARYSEDELTAFRKRADAMLSSQTTMRRLFGKQRRDSRTSFRLTIPHFSDNISEVMKVLDLPVIASIQIPEKNPLILQVNPIQHDKQESVLKKEPFEEKNAEQTKKPSLNRKKSIPPSQRANKLIRVNELNSKATGSGVESGTEVILFDVNSQDKKQKSVHKKENGAYNTDFHIPGILELLQPDYFSSVEYPSETANENIKEDVIKLLLNSGRGVIAVGEVDVAELKPNFRSVFEYKTNMVPPATIFRMGTFAGDKELLHILRAIPQEIRDKIFSMENKYPIRYYRSNSSAFYFISPVKGRELTVTSQNGNLITNAGPFEDRLFRVANLVVETNHHSENKHDQTSDIRQILLARLKNG